MFIGGNVACKWALCAPLHVRRHRNNNTNNLSDNEATSTTNSPHTIDSTNAHSLPPFDFSRNREARVREWICGAAATAFAFKGFSSRVSLANQKAKSRQPRLLSLQSVATRTHPSGSLKNDRLERAKGNRSRSIMFALGRRRCRLCCRRVRRW